MKLGLIAGIALLALIGKSSAGGLYFDVGASNNGLSIPIFLCLRGATDTSCESYVVTGRELDIKVLSDYQASYLGAGIKINIPGYTIRGCTPNAEGFCIFPANCCRPVHISLT